MKKKGKDRLGYALMGFVVLALGVVLIVPMALEKDVIGDDLCVEGKPIHRHFLFVIDQSDPVPTKNVEQLQMVFSRVLKSLGQNDRISVFYMDENASPFSEANRSICNPGRGSDANELFENAARIEAVFRKNFLQPLELALSEEAFAKQAGKSPIMGFLKDVTQVERYMPPARERTYYIVSDLIENSELLNQYKVPRDFPEVVKSDQMLFHNPDFRGVEVNLIYVERENLQTIQNTAHKRFWHDYFKQYGAFRINLL